MKPLKNFPVYFFLFSIYPVLALLSFNINEVEPGVLWRPLLVVSGLGCLTFLALGFLLKDWHKSALIITLLFLLFFTYGHVYSYLKAIKVSNIVLGRHRFLVPIWLGLGVLSIIWISRKVRAAQRFASTLNLIAIFLLVYPVFQVVTYVWSEAGTRSAAQAAQVSINKNLPAGYAPDIYYIILDAYGRDDLLRDVFNYDNTPFLNSLKSKGFYIAGCSQSNYAQSMLSITSSLNMNYLDRFTNALTPNTNNRAPLRALGQYNQTRQFLDGLGYNTVSFATNFPASEWKDADYFLEPTLGGMNDFELMLVQTSVGRAWMDSFAKPTEDKSAEWYRARTLFALEQLETKVLDIPSPRFVFVHLVIPHHPFVFGPNGEELDNIIHGVPEFPDYVAGYKNQVTYINRRIQILVEKILAESENPPVIVIQGDHGPAPFDIDKNRMYILNAYYLPEGSENLYETITPVNTFRIIFNQYFNQRYELLEDISYFSEYDVPYNYQIIPNTCGSK